MSEPAPSRIIHCPFCEIDWDEGWCWKRIGGDLECPDCGRIVVRGPVPDPPAAAKQERREE